MKQHQQPSHVVSPPHPSPMMKKPRCGTTPITETTTTCSNLRVTLAKRHDKTTAVTDPTSASVASAAAHTHVTACTPVPVFRPKFTAVKPSRRPVPLACLLGTADSRCPSGAASCAMGEDRWRRPEWVIAAVTRDLQDLSASNVANGHTGKAPPDLKMFYSQHEQPFSLEFYVARLSCYYVCSASAFVAALVYLDRIHVLCPRLALVDMNLHRLLATSLLLAVKYLDDEVCKNSYYAKVAGIPTQELNQLEAMMLNILDWRLSIAPDLFIRYETSLLDVAALECDMNPH